MVLVQKAIAIRDGEPSGRVASCNQHVSQYYLRETGLWSTFRSNSFTSPSMYGFTSISSIRSGLTSTGSAAKSEAGQGCGQVFKPQLTQQGQKKHTHISGPMTTLMNNITRPLITASEPSVTDSQVPSQCGYVVQFSSTAY